MQYPNTSKYSWVVAIKTKRYVFVAVSFAIEDSCDIHFRGDNVAIKCTTDDVIIRGQDWVELDTVHNISGELMSKF